MAGKIKISDEASIRNLLKEPAEQQISNKTDREAVLVKATARLMREVRKARKDPAAFIEFAFRTPKLGRIKLADFHRFWLNRFQNANRVQIEASKNHGKCCIGSERILLADLSYKPIEELYEAKQPIHILTYDTEMACYYPTQAYISDNGIASVVRADLASGNCITRTPDEPIFNGSEFIPLRNFVCGQYVASANLQNAEWLNDSYLIASEPFYLDTIIDMQLLAPTQTYSISVPANPVYIGEGVISHNTTNVIGYLTWAIGDNPQIRSKLFTQSAAKARQRLQVVSTVIQHNKYVHLVFPELKRDKEGPWHKTAIQVIRENKDEKEPTLEAMGIMGSVEGGRADLLLFDDICDFRSSILYPQIRESLKNKVFAEILPMLDVGGRAISIATPHHNCLHPDTLVLTSKGRKPAKAITTADEIWVSPGTFETPLHVSAFKTEEGMIELGLEHSPEILRLTTNHRVPTKRGLHYVSELRIGDYLQVEGFAGRRGFYAPFEDMGSLLHELDSRLCPMPFWLLLGAKIANPESTVSNLFDIWFKDNFSNSEQLCSENICLPVGFECLPEACIAATFLSWLDAASELDASIGITPSMDLAYDWQRALAGLGIFASICFSSQGYSLSVSADGIADLALLAALPREFPNIAHSIWQRIISIKEVAIDDEVVDITTSSGYFFTASVKVHNSDAVSALRGNKQWESYRFPVGKGEDPFHPLWPDVITREVLKAKLEEVGLTEYNRAFRLMEIQLGQKLIKPEHIRYYTAQDLGDPYQLECVQAYDLAAAEANSSSFFAGATLLYDKNRDLIFVADAWRDRVEIPMQPTVVIRDFMTWDASLVLLEETGYQSALRKYILERLEMMDSTSVAQKLRYVLKGVSPGSKSKELRLMEILPLFEAGRILFHPNMNPASGPNLAVRGDLITQLLNFAKGKEADMADAFVHAVKGTYSFHRREDEDDIETEWDMGDGMETRLLLV